jgi:ankyrin repeat protein
LLLNCNFAIDAGHLAVAQYLQKLLASTKRGVRFLLASSNGYTPMDSAVANGHIHIAEFLLRLGSSMPTLKEGVTYDEATKVWVAEGKVAEASQAVQARAAEELLEAQSDQGAVAFAACSAVCTLAACCARLVLPHKHSSAEKCAEK